MHTGHGPPPRLRDARRDSFAGHRAVPALRRFSLRHIASRACACAPIPPSISRCARHPDSFPSASSSNSFGCCTLAVCCASTPRARADSRSKQCENEWKSSRHLIGESRTSSLSSMLPAHGIRPCPLPCQADRRRCVAARRRGPLSVAATTRRTGWARREPGRPTGSRPAFTFPRQRRPAACAPHSQMHRRTPSPPGTGPTHCLEALCLRQRITRRTAATRRRRSC